VIEVGALVLLGAARERWTVGRLLGEGGQGAVFELLPEDGGNAPLALKWYFPNSGNRDQRIAIRRLISRRQPNASFLWPLEIVDGDGDTFGYTMPLRPPGYRAVGDLLVGRVPSDPRLVITLCIGLADAFLRLHAEGLCYRDISFGNVFFDPSTGMPLICDNDNVGVDGDSVSSVLGTRRFMAPEIIRGEAAPSARTDLHSLAVLLFYLLVVHHPLLGQRELSSRGREGETALLGTDPVFIFDPGSDANYPDPVTQPGPIARWKRYPAYIQALFVQGFTVGLASPARRVRESVWRSALVRLRDEIVVCGWCRHQNLTVGGVIDACVSCRRALEPAVRLLSDGTVLVLNEGTVLTRNHVFHDFDVTTPMGKVIHDLARERWGLENVSDEMWRIDVPGRPAQVALTGQKVALIPGASIIIAGTRFVVSAGTA
jgi:DNA-binding helix-hairpin-helix protein with protein kinase domain